MKIRAATHSGSWYSGSATKLNRQINSLLADSASTVPGARILVGPHAGYSFAGSTLAETYKAFDPTGIKRVFIMGPSHHVYFKGSVYVTDCDLYETPLGDIPVDKEVIKELTAQDPKLFKLMPLSMDEEEHSFEMHMPFLYRVTKDYNNGTGEVPKIIPIMISASDEAFEKKIAGYLKPYFENKENAFVISTDFCHWGSRFSYTAYTPSEDVSVLKKLNYSSKLSSDTVPIYKSIEYLDRKGMEVASTGSYKDWKRYIANTGNTICGAKPISVLLLIMESFYSSSAQESVDEKLKWIGYTQSNPATSVDDSSVSYASGYAVL